MYFIYNDISKKIYLDAPLSNDFLKIYPTKNMLNKFDVEDFSNCGWKKPYKHDNKFFQAEQIEFQKALLERFS